MDSPPLEMQLATFAAFLKRRADSGYFDGRPRSEHYVRWCRRIHEPTRTVVIFTRDVGHHTSGWFRNPDYERCLHLSLSPAPATIITTEPLRAELGPKLERQWCDAFFGEYINKLWRESPKSPEGIRAGVTHWRLFCDAHWQPIIPRGEVYSREFTEKGWQSGSEVWADVQTDGQFDPNVSDGLGR